MKINYRFALSLACLAAGIVVGFSIHEFREAQAQPQPQAIPAIPRELTSYRDIVKQVAPAVVSIEVKPKGKKPANLKMLFNGETSSDNERTQAPKRDEPITFGSGVIIDPKGVILTNYHVLEHAESVEICLPDGRKFTGKDWRFDRKTDLAIIRIESDRPFPFLDFGDSDMMEVGDRVLAIGAPFKLIGSVTHGIISAKSRNIRLNQYEDFLQTEAAINPGNSGGPLVNLEGKIIGLNSAIKSKSGGFQGVGLAISSNLARDVARELLKNGTVRRGYLGVQARDIDIDLAAKYGVKPGGGVLVTRIFEPSPAAKTGLVVGDVLISIAGNPVRSSIELQKVITGLTLNQPVDVLLHRDGKAVQLKLTVEEQPEEFGVAPPKGKE